MSWPLAALAPLYQGDPLSPLHAKYPLRSNPSSVLRRFTMRCQRFILFSVIRDRSKGFICNLLNNRQSTHPFMPGTSPLAAKRSKVYTRRGHRSDTWLAYAQISPSPRLACCDHRLQMWTVLLKVPIQLLSGILVGFDQNAYEVSSLVIFALFNILRAARLRCSWLVFTSPSGDEVYSI